MKPAPGHPDRPHVAKGLCKSCYGREHNSIDNSPARVESKKRARETWRRTVHGRTSRILAQAKSNSKGRTFDLEHADIVIPERCPVLGIPLDCAKQRPSPNAPSIDRIDNTKGYVKGNVGIISWKANSLKGAVTLPELRLLVRALEVQEVRRFRRSSHARLQARDSQP